MKRENEQLKRMLDQEASEREEEAKEIALARMAAIKASRALGRQSLTGNTRHVACHVLHCQYKIIVYTCRAGMFYRSKC